METMWYYVKNGTDKLGPVAESELLGLASSGQVLPSDLVWCEGMSDWLPMNTVPALSGQPAQAAAPAGAVYPTGALPQQMGHAAAPRAEIPAGLVGWMSFVGVMNIIGGALTCFAGVLSIITIIGPILYIPMGVLLIVAGVALNAGKAAIVNATSFDAHVGLFLEKIKRFLVIQGVFYIISMVLTAIGIVVMLFMIFGMGMSFQDMMESGQY